MEDEPIPPRIPKPDQLSIHHLNVQQIADAFDVEYYRKRTGSWNNYTMEGATKHMKYMLESVLKLFEDQFEEIESVGFRHQSKTIKDQILHQYISNLEERNSGYSRLALAMLKSTKEDNQWLFLWTAKMVLKNMKRRRPSSTGSSRNTASGGSAYLSGKKKGGLTIEELVNHDGD
ncbi:hypothetical protein TWF132_007530 [Orbilia oligospora]|nr:hypothetical protein TWF132_007530 [Orbilia oligospora]